MEEMIRRLAETKAAIMSGKLPGEALDVINGLLDFAEKLNKREMISQEDFEPLSEDKIHIENMTIYIYPPGIPK